jgi:hypothetical protein
MATDVPQIEQSQFVLLRRYRDLPEAVVFKSILESAGFECYLSDENMVRMDWFWSNLLGCAKLWVRLQDIDHSGTDKPQLTRGIRGRGRRRIQTATLPELPIGRHMLSRIEQARCFHQCVHRNSYPAEAPRLKVSFVPSFMARVWRLDLAHGDSAAFPCIPDTHSSPLSPKFTISFMLHSPQQSCGVHTESEVRRWVQRLPFPGLRFLEFSCLASL